MGDVDRLLAVERPSLVAGGDDGKLVIGLGLAGRRDEARRVLLHMRRDSYLPLFQAWIDYLLAWLDRRTSDMVFDSAAFRSLKIQDDPEAIFEEGWLLCDVGEHEKGLVYLQRAVAKGYCVAPTLARSHQFDALRSNPAFQALLKDAEAGRQQALVAFREAGGERLLGI